MSDASLQRLQAWYFAQCDEDWEHTYGIRIETLDNPGWLLTIDLTDTVLADRTFTRRRYGADETTDFEKDLEHADWIDCRVESGRFVAAGGPRKLAELIDIFLEWAGWP